MLGNPKVKGKTFRGSGGHSEWGKGMYSPEPVLPMAPQPEHLAVSPTSRRGANNGDLPGRFGGFGCSRCSPCYHPGCLIWKKMPALPEKARPPAPPVPASSRQGPAQGGSPAPAAAASSARSSQDAPASYAAAAGAALNTAVARPSLFAPAAQGSGARAADTTQGSRSRASSRVHFADTMRDMGVGRVSFSSSPLGIEAERLEAEEPACPQLQLTSSRAPPGGRPAESLLHRPHPLRAVKRTGRCRM